MSAEKSTPRPWYLAASDNASPFILNSDLPMGTMGFMADDPRIIEATICALNGDGNGWANAHLIVRAVNCHAKLVEALETLMRFQNPAGAYSKPKFVEACEQARAALKLAEANDGE